jgi:hypothetical protein
MTFLFDCRGLVGHSESMSTISRISLFTATISALAALWVLASPKTAIAVGFFLFAYLFVFAMKSAAEEILRFEADQRPDLCA